MYRKSIISQADKPGETAFLWQQINPKARSIHSYVLETTMLTFDQNMYTTLFSAPKNATST